MSDALDRLRARNAAYRADIAAFDTSLRGDGDSPYSMIGPAVSELSTMAEKYAQDEAAKKKAAADKAAYDKSDARKAELEAEALRKKADELDLKARTLRAKAGVTKLPQDDKAAANAEDLAKLSDIDAKAAEEKAARLGGRPGAGGADAGKRGASGPGMGFVIPTWGKIALGALGAAGVGLVGYKLLKKKKG